ncbi:MAG TPA: YjbQ family protein [Acidimicrobiia bacterium]|nr:YjbQ family protein [Acidimicrobiia bacterium]
MDTEELVVATGGRPAVVDITADLARFASGRGDGLLSVFVPHATAGVAILEVGAGSDHDLLTAIDELLPAERGRWHHEHGSPGHGRDHVLPAFVSPSVTIPVVAGHMTLGTWQSVILVDTNVDNRTRKVRLSFIAG